MRLLQALLVLSVASISFVPGCYHDLDSVPLPGMDRGAPADQSHEHQPDSGPVDTRGDTPGLDGPAVDGPAVDGPAVDGPVVDVTADTSKPDVKANKDLAADTGKPDVVNPNDLPSVDATAKPDAPPVDVSLVDAPVADAVVPQKPKLLLEYVPTAATGATVSDTSGAGNHGKLTGGKWNTALELNGTSTYIEVPKSKSLGAPAKVTVTAWINLAAITTGAQMILDNTHQGLKGFHLSVDNGKATLTLFGATLKQTLTGNTTLSAKKWHHVAATYDGAWMRIYLDGKPDGTKALSGGLIPSGEAIFVGTPVDKKAGWLNGSLDELKLCKVAKAEGRIYDEYVRGGIQKDLLLHFRLDEGKGTVAKDASGVGNPGTIKGSPAWKTGRGKVAGSLLLDGAGDYVLVKPWSNLTALFNVSVAAWVKLEDTAQGTIIHAKGSSGYALRVSKGKPCFTIYTPTAVEHCGSTSLKAGVWQHVVGTYDTKAIKVYLDGMTHGSKSLALGLMPSGAATAMVGGDVGTGSGWLKGEVGRVRVYSYAMPHKDVLKEAPPVVAVLDVGTYKIKGGYLKGLGRLSTTSKYAVVPYYSTSNYSGKMTQVDLNGPLPDAVLSDGKLTAWNLQDAVMRDHQFIFILQGGNTVTKSSILKLGYGANPPKGGNIWPCPKGSAVLSGAYDAAKDVIYFTASNSKGKTGSLSRYNLSTKAKTGVNVSSGQTRCGRVYLNAAKTKVYLPCQNKKIFVFDVGSDSVNPKVLTSVTVLGVPSLTASAMSPDGKYLAVHVPYTNTINMISTASNTIARKFTVTDKDIGLTFSKDGTMLLVSNGQVLDVASGVELAKLGHAGKNIELSPDASTLLLEVTNQTFKVLRLGY